MTPDIMKTPDGRFQATDQDTLDGSPDSEWPADCIGYGDSREEALKDLCDLMELPYSLVPNGAVTPTRDDACIERME